MTAPLIRTLEADTVGCAAATDQVTIIGRAPYAGVVTAVEYIPEASVTGLTLAFGETAGGFRRLIQIIFGLSIAFAASSFFLSFFSFGGGALIS